MAKSISEFGIQLEQVLVNLITNACEAMAGKESPREPPLHIDPQTMNGQSF